MQSVDATPIFYLDNEVNKQTRRSFLKKAGLALGALIFSAYTGIMTTGCKNPDGPTPPATYNLTLFPLDIFNQQGLTGNLIVNGTSKPAGSTYSIENGSISSIDAQIPGYNSAYILTRDASGNVKFTRDASGYHSITISSDSTFYAFLIPDSFDTTLFVKCTGEGNGTVQNYGKTAVNVGIMKSPTPDGMDPTPQTIANLTRSIELYNTAAVNTMKLNYLGQIDSELVDGVSHFVVNSFSLHVETLSGNTIYKSFLATHPFATPRAILEELTQAASGLRVDGGYSNFPYVSGDELNPQYVRDGARAIQLNQLLPAGFKLSTTGTPAVYIMEHPGLVSPGLITPPLKMVTDMAFTQLIFAEIIEMAYLSPYYMTTTKTYAKTMIGSIPDINPIGNFIGEPEYREIKSIIPSKNNLLRPEQEKQKEKIREKY